MESPQGYLIDTNILLRLSHRSDPQHWLVQAALDKLDKQGVEFYIALQNMAEFWSVCTRPTKQNGYGLSIAETDHRAAAIERIVTLLPGQRSCLLDMAKVGCAP